MKIVPLTRGYAAKMDDADLAVVAKYKWYTDLSERGRSAYARTNIRKNDGQRGFLLMHRLILGINDPTVAVDHIDGDGTNNQRANLRVCTKSENARNRRRFANSSSRYVGVSLKIRGKGKPYPPHLRRWLAKISSNGEIHRIGSFFTEEAAAVAYNASALRVHGEFARMNKVVFPRVR